MKSGQTRPSTYLESIIVICIGIFIVVFSLLVQDNPVVLEGWANVFTQARFFPLIIGTAVILMGLFLLRKTKRGQYSQTKVSRDEAKRILLSIAFVAVYILLVVIASIPFAVATCAYLLGTLLYLNFRSIKLLKILLLAAVFTLLGSYLLPMVLHITLP